MEEKELVWLQGKRVAINTTIPLKIYQYCKEKGIKFSRLAEIGFLSLIREKEQNEKFKELKEELEIKTQALMKWAEKQKALLRLLEEKDVIDKEELRRILL